jgi:Fur family peroxide stress response transcriptional regulator
MSSVTMNAPDALAQRLASSGLRSTPQRELIYGVLLSRRDHPTADEVYARVRADMPSISLATVYNCLETFVQCGLVKAVHFERASTRYCPNLSPHAHFHDEQSGSIHDIDLPPELLEKVTSVLPPGFDAKSVEVTFRGSTGSPRPERVEGHGQALKSSEHRVAGSE